MLIGSRFGRLEVISQIPKVVREGKEKKKKNYWLCRCDCGGEKYVRTNSLNSGKTRSCGCLQEENRKNLKPEPRKPKYGMGLKKEYGIKRSYVSWAMMKSRCSNPNDSGFNNYGGRGITVCERWMVFQNFLDDMGIRPEGMTIERKDVNGNYELGNCKWATMKEQNDNKRWTIRIKFPGRDDKETLTAGCARLGLGKNIIYNRLNKGMSIEEAICYVSPPKIKRLKEPRERFSNLSAENFIAWRVKNSLSIKQCAEKLGLSESAIYMYESGRRRVPALVALGMAAIDGGLKPHLHSV